MSSGESSQRMQYDVRKKQQLLTFGVNGNLGNYAVFEEEDKIIGLSLLLKHQMFLKYILTPMQYSIELFFKKEG